MARILPVVEASQVIRGRTYLFGTVAPSDPDAERQICFGPLRGQAQLTYNLLRDTEDGDEIAWLEGDGYWTFPGRAEKFSDIVIETVT